MAAGMKVQILRGRAEMKGPGEEGKPRNTEWRENGGEM